MAFRAASYLKSMVINGGLRGSSNFTTSTSQKLKAYAPTADQLLHPPQHVKARLAKGDYVPVCAAAGGIILSTSLGIYTAMHQLGRAPNVFLKKSKRQTVPEVVEPERVAAESEKFVKHSLFRKVAHVRNSNHQEIVPNPIVGDPYTRPVHVETLKDIGLDPKA